MPKASVGDRFGRWTVLEKINYGRWKFVCDCGTVKYLHPGNIRGGKSRSCGCLKAELPAYNKTHGMTGRGETTRRKVYGVWATMKSRCHNPNAWNYRNYGARGIQVCQRWRDSFLDFLQDMGEPPEGMTIDRIDGNGNYEPGNCRWATRKQQSRNLRSNRVGSVGGESMCVGEAAERFGVKYRTIMSRMNRGLTMEQALSETSKHPESASK